MLLIEYSSRCAALAWVGRSGERRPEHKNCAESRLAAVCGAGAGAGGAGAGLVSNINIFDEKF